MKLFLLLFLFCQGMVASSVVGPYEVDAISKTKSGYVLRAHRTVGSGTVYVTIKRKKGKKKLFRKDRYSVRGGTYYSKDFSKLRTVLRHITAARLAKLYKRAYSNPKRYKKHKNKLAKENKTLKRFRKSLKTWEKKKKSRERAKNKANIELRKFLKKKKYSFLAKVKRKKLRKSSRSLNVSLQKIRKLRKAIERSQKRKRNSQRAMAPKPGLKITIR